MGNVKQSELEWPSYLLVTMSLWKTSQDWRLSACTVSPVSALRSTEIRVRECHRHIHLGQPDKLAANADSVMNTTCSYRHQNPLHQTHYMTTTSRQQMRSSSILTNRGDDLFWAGHINISFTPQDSDRCLSTCTPLSKQFNCTNIPAVTTRLHPVNSTITTTGLPPTWLLIHFHLHNMPQLSTWLLFLEWCTFNMTAELSFKMLPKKKKLLAGIIESSWLMLSESRVSNKHLLWINEHTISPV